MTLAVDWAVKPQHKQTKTAENKYMYLESENKQIIPSLIDFMTGRFSIVILFMKRIHGSADFAFQTQSQS